MIYLGGIKVTFSLLIASRARFNPNKTSFFLNKIDPGEFRYLAGLLLSLCIFASEIAEVEVDVDVVVAV